MMSESTATTEPNASKAQETTSKECIDTEEGTDTSLLELTRGLQKEEGEKGSGKTTSDTKIVPPPTPQSGISILAHKIWIGNLDKRLPQ